MSNETKTVLNDDLLDDELMHMPGLNISDLTKGQPSRPATRRSNPVTQPKEAPAAATAPTAQKGSMKPMDAHYDQLDDDDGVPMLPSGTGDGLDFLRECVSRTLPLTCLSILFFYWQQTGLLAESASFPAIVVCTALFGISVGHSIGKHIK